jgi:cobalt-zinc-cadmium efflux system outer membrane protein
LRLVLRFNVLFVMIGVVRAQVPQATSPPSMISMDDPVRIALAYNQSLRAQRLNIDQNRAEEITAALKPNPTFTTLVDTIPLFSPQIIRFNTQIYSESLACTCERGGKRERRLDVAKDNTDVTAKTVTDNERTHRFQVVQALINVLLAKSVLQFAKEDLANFSQAATLASDRGDARY